MDTRRCYEIGLTQMATGTVQGLHLIGIVTALFSSMSTLTPGGTTWIESTPGILRVAVIELLAYFYFFEKSDAFLM